MDPHPPSSSRGPHGFGFDYPSTSTSTLTSTATARRLSSRSSSHYDTSPPSTPLNRGSFSRFDKGKGPALHSPPYLHSHSDWTSSAPASASDSASASTSGSASTVRQQTGRHTFLDSHVSPIEESFGIPDSPANVREHDYYARRNHARGQSWSSVTRDSVVDNLLLSFDRMPGQDFPPFGLTAAPPTAISRYIPRHDDDFGDVDYGATPPRIGGSRPQQRPRGHTYSSSLSTDMSSVDDSASYYSRNLASRGKRSDSGSSYMDSPVSMPRIRDGRARMLSRSSSETQRTPRIRLHSRGSGKKGSAASSFDYGYGQIISADQLALSGAGPGPGRPGPSDNMFTHSAPEMRSNSILGRGRPVPSQFSTYELSSESAGSGGPGSGSRSGSGSGHGMAALSASTSKSSLTALPHHNNTLSRVSETSPLNSPNNTVPPPPAVPQAIRDQASEFVKATNMRNASQSPGPGQQRAESRASGRQIHTSAGDSSTQRPNFFRRVFGSSNRSSTADLDKQLSRESSTGPDTPQQAPRKKSLPLSLSNPTQVHSDAKPLSSPVPATVSKKQSFFRRRKKSLTDDCQPPALPPHILNSSTHPSHQQPPGSPSQSSLRRVLDQFLLEQADAAVGPSGQVPLSRFPLDAGDNDSDSLEMFHSGYTPPPDATLRRVSPLDHRSSIANKLPARNVLGDVQASNQTTHPEPHKLHVGTMENENHRPDFRQGDSFLTDASDGDERSRAPSVISAISDTYGLPGDAGGGPFSPVSPIYSPSSESFHGGAYFASPSSTHSDPPMSPGATIRRTTSPFERTLSPDSDFGIVEAKGLAIEMPRRSRGDRLFIDSTASSYISDDQSLPIGSRQSSRTPSLRIPNQESDRKSSVPVVEVNGNEIRPSVDIARQLDAATSTEPTAEDAERARMIFNGEEEFVSKLQAASWLGEKTPISGRTLAAYMAFFDWQGQNILSAMRSFCERLTLKGESQQVDRILEAFANRWHECNPNNGFKGPSVVHNICYALLLLNTDQHVADIQHKMTRSEFIKNTMPAVKDSAVRTIRPTKQLSKPPIPWMDSAPDSPTLPSAPQDDCEDRNSNDFKRSMKRLSIRPAVYRNETDPGPMFDVNNYASNTLINFGYEGSERGWLLEVENVLKSFYNSIVADALPLHGASDKDSSNALNTSGNLSVRPAALRRTGSVISKAPSEGFSYRGRKVSDTQSLTNRWHSKNRPRQKPYPASTVGSTRTSFEDGNSMLSPAGSSMWSRISNGRTQPTMSVESLALTYDFKQSLGFTNALSQAIIREETISDSDSFHRVGSLLEDESLELAGAPWAKEGMVKHKHHLEGPDKKAKERSWNECFAVVEKGYLHLFSFNKQSTTKISNGAARARKNTTTTRAPSVTPSVVGGGNWTDSAEELGQFLLRQTIATSLPTPGYSKSRPHVWALSLPSGAVHLFQVGTAEIAEEFASTANYWSARLSKEPLVGGVDNIEYGWSDNVLNPALVSTYSPPPSRSGVQSAPGHHGPSNSLSTIAQSQSHQGPPGSAHARPSMQSTLRTSLDQSFSNKPRLPGDRAIITDWRPPAASMLPSQLLEIDQLRSLKAYITSVDAATQPQQR